MYDYVQFSHVTFNIICLLWLTIPQSSATKSILKLLQFAEGLPNLLLHKEKSSFQGSAIWLQNDIELLFNARPAFLCGKVVILSSVNHAPLNINIFVLVFRVPDILQ